MAKKKKPIEELDLEEAINVVKRLSKPDRPNEELELLKKASSTLLNEVQPGFEFEEDEDGGSGAAKDELTKAPGFMEQIGAQAAALGPAGLIALGSAAYFQIDTVVEETRVVQQVAEEKWEEVKLEHPNINWDDPLAGFTTIIGMGDIEIDLDPPASSGSTGNTPSDDTTKGNLNANKSTTVSEESGESDEEGTQETDSKEDDTNDEPVEDSKEEPVEEETEEKAEEPEEQEEKPKKKKKGLFGLFGGDDDEAEEEEAKEESEPEQEAEPEEVEAEEESNEPEPEAEEQVEEQPKKKKGFFSFLTGGDDDNEKPDSEEQGEPTPDDQVPEEQADEADVNESENKTVAETTSNESNESSDSGIKKSKGGGLPALFGINNNKEEVVEQSEVSTDEEPAIVVAEVDSGSETPPISTDEEVEIAPIDEIDVIKPHSDFEVTETEVEVAPEIEVAEVEIDIADIVVNADVVVDNIEIDTGIEITAIDNIIEQVITPNEGIIIVSPSGALIASRNF